METDRATRTALVRWTIIAEATDERLSPGERGRIVSVIAGRVHRGVDGQLFRVTTRTVYRWLERWRTGGFDALKPQRRRDAGVARIDGQILALAADLRREAPARSAAHIAEILARTRGWDVSARTLQRHLAAAGLDRVRLEGRHRAYGRFETVSCGDLWMADGWDGPVVAELGGGHAQLFSILDDHSRLIVHATFGRDVGEWTFQRCLRRGIERRGLPRRLYLDHGSAFISDQLKLICGRLGITIVHSRAGHPQGRGKHERHFRTVAEQFAVEVDVAGVDTLAELNRYWTGWVEQVYHRRVHAGTDATPLDRWTSGPNSLRPTPDPETLREAFLWHSVRTVTRTRTVSLHGNVYEVDPSLVGVKVDLVYDPTDLAVIYVVCNGQPASRATPFRIGVHVDPKLRNALPSEPGPATGVAYLDAVVADQANTLRGQMSYQPPPAANNNDNDNDNEDLP